MNEDHIENSEREKIRSLFVPAETIEMGLRLMRAYERVSSCANRLKVIELAESLADMKGNG